MRKPNEPSDVFKRYVIEEGTGCFVYTGTIMHNGYGRISISGIDYSAHRLAFEIAKGPIPDGLHLDHLCRNRRCINPDHLEPVTCKENILLGVDSRRRNATKTHCPKGHAYDSDVMRIGPSGKKQCRECDRLRWLERKRKGLVK